MASEIAIYKYLIDSLTADYFNMNLSETYRQECLDGLGVLLRACAAWGKRAN